MEEEMLKKLLKIREQLEIPMEDYTDILAAAIKRRKESTAKISDEVLFGIILSCLTDYDYDYDMDLTTDLVRGKKNVYELLDRALLSYGLMDEEIDEETKLTYLIDEIVREDLLSYEDDLEDEDGKNYVL